MKCEKCNKNEANFHYSCNVNGESNEVHLCSECARASGFGELMNYRTNDMFSGFINDFFHPAYTFLPGFGMFGDLRRSIMAPMLALPQTHIRVGDDEMDGEKAEAANQLPDKADEALNARRELTALKNQLEEAVKAEDFEKAIELRDKIKQLQK